MFHAAGRQRPFDPLAGNHNRHAAALAISTTSLPTGRHTRQGSTTALAARPPAAADGATAIGANAGWRRFAGCQVQKDASPAGVDARARQLKVRAARQPDQACAQADHQAANWNSATPHTKDDGHRRVGMSLDFNDLAI
jgi:hypothetical protein